jgi:Enoyl-CoA hydratase/carnithine racemase
LRTIGSSKALSILIEGKIFKAKDAQKAGILNEVEETHEALGSRINEIKKTYQSTSIQVIRGIKAVNVKQKQLIHEKLKEAELDSFKKTWMSDEHWKKVEALLSK